jgi:hypothetical protein
MVYIQHNCKKIERPLEFGVDLHRKERDSMFKKKKKLLYGLLKV